MSTSDLNKSILRTIRNIMPDIIARDILSVQPMNVKLFSYRYKIRGLHVVCYFMEYEKIEKLKQYCNDNNIVFKFLKMDKLDTSLIIKCNSEDEILYLKLKELI